MSNVIVREVAVKKCGQAPPRVEKNQAVSFLVPFSQVRHLIEGYPAPRRPNRVRPAIVDDPELRDEFNAWDAASDEAFEAMERPESAPPRFFRFGPKLGNH